MKAKLFLALSLFFLSFYSPMIFADCGSCGSSGSCGGGNSSGYSCPDYSCECTDYGYRWNDCMTKDEYCEAFGNVGALYDSGSSCADRW